MDEERKKRLKVALENERNTLPEYNYFGEKNDFKKYDESIKFLEDGIKPKYYNDNDILYAIIEDFDTICSDYDIE